MINCRTYILLQGLLLSCFFCNGKSNLQQPVNLRGGSSAYIFQENKGQLTDQYGNRRDDIQFSVAVPGANVFIGNAAIHYQWTKPVQGKKSIYNSYRLDVELIGANTDALPIEDGVEQGRINYYLPQCPEGVTTRSCSKVVYKNIYPGIDWVLYTKDSKLKYDFIVYPGANPQQIRLKYSGATSLSLSEGALLAATPAGSITEHAPYAYSEEAKENVDVSFSLDEDILSFMTSPHTGTLVIDPELVVASYFGGQREDYSNAITADAGGYMYIAGSTLSPDLIVTVGAHQNFFAGTQDAFIARFYNSGQRDWITYYGGNDIDELFSVACDAQGNAYVCGATKSSTGIASAGSHQPGYGGVVVAQYGDGFLVKFNTNGTRQWATYYGGGNEDVLTDVVVYKDTCVYVTGYTSSFNNIATTGSYQSIITDPSTLGTEDILLARFNADGERRWGTYFGKSGTDKGNSVTVDALGNVYIAGYTKSFTGITTAGVQQENYGGTGDGLLAKFSAAGNLQWATYYGGSDNDQCNSVAFDPSGYVYVGGTTSSLTNIASAGSHKSVLTDAIDGFVAKFNLNGQREWGTYYGGSYADYIYGVSVNGYSQVYLYGATNSPNGISTPDGYQPVKKLSQDMFFARLSATGLRKTGSYFGGNDHEGSTTLYGNTLFCQGTNFYFTGTTQSDSGIAAKRSNSYQIYQDKFGGPNAGGNWLDGFFAVFDDDPPQPIEVLGPFTDTVLCPGDTFYVKYDLSPPPFQFPNEFVVTLSDSKPGGYNGNLGRLQTTAPGTIRCIVPFDVPAGSGYRIAVRSTIPPVSAPVDVNIRIKPSPWPVNIISNSPVCEGDSLLLNSGDTVQGASYKWKGPGSFLASDKRVFIAKPLIDNSGSYTVFATLNGCTASDTDSVSILPAPRLQSVGSNSPLCEGYVLLLMATDSATGVTYSWTGPGGFSSSSKNPQLNNPTIKAQGVYTLTANIGSCYKQASTVVVIKQRPGLIDVKNNGPVCVGEDVQFEVIDSSGVGNYEWLGPQGFVSEIKNPLITKATLNASGMYILTMDNGGCFAKDSVELLVKPVPEISLSTNSPVKAGDSIVILLDNTIKNATYTWVGPAFFESNEKNIAIYPATPEADGLYSVLAEVNGCKANASTVVKVLTPDEDLFVLFPNPNKGSFTIRGDVRTNTRLKLEIIDEIGRLVHKEYVTPENYRVNADVTLPGYLPNAVYRLVIKIGNAQKVIAFTLSK